MNINEENEWSYGANGLFDDANERSDCANERSDGANERFYGANGWSDGVNVVGKRRARFLQHGYHFQSYNFVTNEMFQ